jgi:hypothetical protein
MRTRLLAVSAQCVQRVSTSDRADARYVVKCKAGQLVTRLCFNNLVSQVSSSLNTDVLIHAGLSLIKESDSNCCIRDFAAGCSHETRRHRCVFRNAGFR